MLLGPSPRCSGSLSYYIKLAALSKRRTSMKVMRFIRNGFKLGIKILLEPISEMWIRVQGKASRELITERTRSTWVFQFTGQRSPGHLDAFLRQVLKFCLKSADIYWWESSVDGSNYKDGLRGLKGELIPDLFRYDLIGNSCDSRLISKKC